MALVSGGIKSGLKIYHKIHNFFCRDTVLPIILLVQRVLKVIQILKKEMKFMILVYLLNFNWVLTKVKT